MRLYPEQFLRIKLLCPPTPEQRAIIGAVQRETKDIVSGSARAESEILLLREFRTRLIADVVTGKLDVREAVAKLPYALEDVEPVDADQSDGLDDETQAGEAEDAESEE